MDINFLENTGLFEKRYFIISTYFCTGGEGGIFSSAIVPYLLLYSDNFLVRYVRIWLL